MKLAVKNQKSSRADITLTLADIVKKVHQETGISSSESANLVNSMLEHISDALVQSENVKLPGFGTFKISQKAERIGRNPKTKIEVVIKPRKVVTFKPSNMLKARLNKALGQKTAIQTPKTATQSIAASLQPALHQKLSQAHWTALFELLGLMCGDQDPLSDVKISAFIDAILELKILIDPKADITEQSSRHWLIINKKKLNKLVKTDPSDKRLHRIFTLLNGVEFKLDILCAMVQIAIADGDYNQRERHIIQKAILFWDIPATMSHDIDYICNDIITDIRGAHFAKL